MFKEKLVIIIIIVGKLYIIQFIVNAGKAKNATLNLTKHKVNFIF